MTKSLGSGDKHNIVSATIAALRALRGPEAFASKREISRDRIDHQTRSVVATGKGGLGTLAAAAQQNKDQTA